MLRSRRSPRGLTLLELMVAMAIMAVVIAGLTVAMRDLGRTTAVRRLITDVQGEGRAGAGRLQDDLREASLGSAYGVVMAVTVFGVEARPAVQIFDNVPGGAAWLPVKPGTDAVLVVSAGVRQWDPVTATVRPVQASVNAESFDAAGQPLSVTSVTGFQLGQYVLVGNYKKAGWAAIANIAGAVPGVLQLGVGGNVFPDGKAEVGALVRAAFARLYYVNLRDELVAAELQVPYAPPLAAQVLSNEPVARGVENLQVDCEMDGGGLGWFQGCPGVIAVGNTIANESAASGLANPRLDATSIATLRTVNLSVVVRSRDPVVDETGEPPVAVGNQAALKASHLDQNAAFARRAYRISVGVRNTSLGVL